MMSTTEYKRWLAERRGTAKKPRGKTTPVEQMSFLDWVLTQTARQDAVGVLARDIEGERERIGKPLTSLNHLPDVVWHCLYAPKEIGLSREIARDAWSEWVESQSRKRDVNEEPILFYDI